MQTIFIRESFWLSGYEPHNMPGLIVCTRYHLSPADGGGMVKDGQYKGLVVEGRILRLVFGGEYFNGFLINQDFRDFSFTFDEAFHEMYHEGVIRGFHGKRAVSYNTFCKKPAAWQDGYREGRRAKKAK